MVRTWAVGALVAEIGALVALSRWGLAAGPAGAGRVLLAVGLPLAAAVVWGLFAAPRSVFEVPALAVLTKVLVFGAAAAALAATGSPFLAAALAVLALLSAVLSDPAALQALGAPVRAGATSPGVLPAEGVRGVRGPAGRRQLRQRLLDEVGAHVGHPAQEHEAELAPRRPVHAGRPCHEGHTRRRGPLGEAGRWPNGHPPSSRGST